VAATQQQLDDVLEHLVALTDLPDVTAQRDRLACLVLLLAESLDDPQAVHAAIEEVLRHDNQGFALAIP
jgi:hypothetical protein